MRRIASSELILTTPAQYRFGSATADILVYIVVLNLFIEYVETVVIDSFTISILTAVLLWVMLELVKGVEHRVAGYFREKEGTGFRVLGYLAVFGILFGSKFVILEAVSLAFGGRASLGHFVEVVLIIVAMMAARGLIDWVYHRLGNEETEKRWKEPSAVA